LNRFKGFMRQTIESIQSGKDVEMIPASYLFKGVYRRQWEVPSAEAAQTNEETSDGRTGRSGGRPNWAAITLASPAAFQASRRKGTTRAHSF
jgi:hypothetical protein